MSDSARSDDPTVVDFALLGPLLAARDGHPLQIGGSRQRAVLAQLLLRRNTVVPLAYLVQGVWGDEPPPAAVQTLQTYVFHLRRELEPGRPTRSPSRLLPSSGSGYVLAVDHQHTDVGRFQDAVEASRAARKAGSPREASRLLAAALGMWRGPVLDDLSEYAFVGPEAARLEDLRLAAVEAKLDADLAQGLHDEVAAECETWIARAPLRERLREIAMTALYRAGRQAEALSVYRQARGVLAAEIGVEPGPGLQRVHQAVLRHEPRLDYESPPEQVRMPSTRAPADDAKASAVAAGAAPGQGGQPRRQPAARLLVAAGLGLALLTFGTMALPAAAPAGEPPRDLASTVVVVDPVDGRVVRAVAVGSSPGRLAAGEGAIWVTNRQDATVSRIDPDTMAVTQTIDVGASPEDVAVGAGFVWVASSGARSVAQIDPVTNHVVRNIPVGNGPVAVVATTEAIWVANQFDDTVWRLNPVSGRPVAKIAVGDAPSDLAVVDGSIWVTSSGSATAARIDIGTNQVTGVFGIGNGAAAVGGTGGAGGAVWVANDLDGTVERIDPATGVTRSVEPTGDGPVDLVATGGDVWVTNQHGGTLTRLDGTTGHVSQRIDVGGAPHGVAMVGGRLWVSTGAGPAVTHRGGTLNVLTDGEDNGIDPAMDYAAMMSLVYDGLVALRRTGGASGLTVVPDLATTIPRPSDDGLTYVFTVRRGIRYSDGEMVRPSDIRRGLERNLANRPNSYYANIRGAATCLRSPKPKTCDLTSGVDADDDNYTLTIQLTAPDPDLLAKLSVPFASATAPGAAAVETGRRPLPGTGPYQIKSYTPGPQGSIILVRNPNYREWSWAARPDGFADAITFRFLDHGTEAAVDTGRADVAPISDQEVAVRHRSQVHVSPGSLSFFVFFDTTRPPFNDVRVRQAVNYAIDRRQALAAFGGQISCQVLPPGYPGYQPSCPYTLAPGTQWSAPDLPRAMSLVAASGATGRHVELRAPKVLESLTSTVLTALRRLGFVASLRIVDDDTFFENIETRRATPALGLDGWGTDYPAASGYLGALLSCRGPENAALFCDPRVDRQMRRAAALETSAPAAADAAWADVERVVMTASPVAPLLVETRTIYVSPRLGNYQDNPIEGPLYDQMWVR